MSKYAVKAKRNKGMKNAGHGLNPGRRYWCHASDSLTEPSGPAASQRAHIPISLRYEPKFSQDCHQAIPSHSCFSHLDSHWERHVMNIFYQLARHDTLFMAPGMPPAHSSKRPLTSVRGPRSLRVLSEVCPTLLLR